MSEISNSTNPVCRLRRLAFVVLLLLSFIGGGCAQAQSVSNQEKVENEIVRNINLSTNEAVIAELQKITDAKNARLAGEDEAIAAKRRTVRLAAKNVCLERLKESPRVIVVGAFRYDYDCHFEGAFVDSRFYEANTLEIHENALAALGWEKANQAEREEIARLWVEKGLLAFFTVLQTKTKELENFDSHPPRVVSDEKGGMKITLWFQTPPRMRRGKGFQRVEYRFKDTGEFSGTSTLDAVIAN